MYVSLNLKKYKYNFNQYESIFSIKDSIKKKFNIKKLFNINCNGKILEDKKCLYDYNIKKNDTLIIEFIKKGGMSADEIGQVIGFTILLLIYLVFLMLGVLPFISFVISNMFIKLLKMGLEFLRSLTDQNNWLNSFLLWSIEYIVPFFGFILDYFSMIIIIFIATFICTFKLYQLKWKCKCKALQASKALSTLVTMIIVFIYFLANSFVLLNNFSNKYLPSPIKQPVSLVCQAMMSLRNVWLKFFLLNPIGAVDDLFVNIMGEVFKLQNMLIKYGSMVLYSWDDIYAFTKQPDIQLQLQESGLDTLVTAIQAAEKQIDGKTTANTGGPVTLGKSASNSLIKALYNSFVYFALEITKIFDICGEKPARLKELEEKMDDLLVDKDQLESLIYNKNTKNADKVALRQGVAAAVKSIGDVKKKIEKEQIGKLLNLKCLKDILLNGAVTAMPSLIVFILLFILMFFFVIPI